MARTTPAGLTLSALLAQDHWTYGATRIVFISKEGRYETTIDAIRARAERLAGGLRARGVSSGDVISMQFPLCEEAIIVQLAALMLDAVLVPVVPVFGARELAQMFATAHPAVHLTQTRWRKVDYAANLAEISADERPALIVTTGGATDDTLAWEDIESSDAISEYAAGDEDDANLIVFTSGSTGVPKGVRHTRRTMLAEAFDVGYTLPVGDDELTFFYTSGAGHIAGYVYPLRVLARGMSCVVLDGWDAPLAARIVDEYKPSVMAGLPFHVISMLDAAGESGADLSSLLMATIGGASVPAALVARADAAGIPIVKSYGLTELPTAVLGDVRDSVAVRAEFIGRPSGGNEIRIVDEEGRMVPDGEPGEIHLRGPEMFCGYTNVPADETFTADGWFPTGDVGLITAEGRLVIVDRKKNIIIRGGENLSATEIEELVGTHPSVKDVAVIGVPDDRYGERACAFVVLRENASLDLSELLAHFVAVGASKQKVPEYLEFVEVLPRTATGKLRKNDLVLEPRVS